MKAGKVEGRETRCSGQLITGEADGKSGGRTQEGLEVWGSGGRRIDWTGGQGGMSKTGEQGAICQTGEQNGRDYWWVKVTERSISLFQFPFFSIIALKVADDKMGYVKCYECEERKPEQLSGTLCHIYPRIIYCFKLEI